MRTKEKEEKGNRRRKRREKDTKLKEERRTNGCQRLLADFVLNSFLSSYQTYSSSPPHPPLLSVSRMVITRATHLSLRQPPQSQWDAQKTVISPLTGQLPYLNHISWQVRSKSAFCLHYICRSYYTERERHTHAHKATPEKNLLGFWRRWVQLSWPVSILKNISIFNYFRAELGSSNYAWDSVWL